MKFVNATNEPHSAVGKLGKHDYSTLSDDYDNVQPNRVHAESIESNKCIAMYSVGRRHNAQGLICTPS